MSLETYKLIHLVGMMLVFLGLGGTLLRGSEGGSKTPAILHGVGLLAMLVAGFGMVPKYYSFGTWVYVKIVCWLLLGVMPVLLKKKIVTPFLGWLVALAVGATAAYLGIYKSF